MQLINKKYFWIAGIIVVLLTVVYFQNLKLKSIKTKLIILQSTAQSTSQTQTTETTRNTTQQKTTTLKWKTPKAPIILSPTANEQWEFGKSHTIKWDNATGYTVGLIGGVYLVNAQTKEIAGWITSGLNYNQTSHTWDTRSVSLSKDNPVRKDIQIGAYIIKVALDNKGTEGQSAPFQILYKEQIQVPIHNVTIKDFKFSPEKLTVRKGDKIIFVNADSVTHNISNLGQSIKLLNPGESYELSTNVFSLGQHNLYSEKYSSAKLTLIVN